MRHICHIGIPDDDERYSGEIQDKEKFVFTLALLLNGAFMTFLPTQYEMVRAVPYFPGEGTGTKDNIGEIATDISGSLEIKENGDDEALAGVYIIELSSVESRCDLFFGSSANWSKISKALFDYLEWLETAPAEKNWFMFGSGAYPEMIDIPAVTSAIKRLAGNVTKQSGTSTANGGKYVCDFCGKRTDRVKCLEPTSVNTQRYMCLSCARHSTSGSPEIYKLYRQARRDMERIYNIRLPKNINVKIKSAKSIKKKTKYSGSGRVLGFYNYRTRNLWIEGGGPKEFTLSTMYHELTHAWQFNNVKIRNVKRLPLKIIEGQATYVEVECLKKTHRVKFAKKLANNYRALPVGDPYGDGFRMFEQNVPNSSRNAFMHMEDGTPVSW